MTDIDKQLKIALINLNDVTTTGGHRSYVGMSGVGGCRRALQYQHYWAFDTTHDARTLRLLNFGHMYEEHFISALAAEGFIVTDQQKEFIDSTGHWKGHIDGIANDTYLVEFKTHNDSSFKALKKIGVMSSKPGHYAQIQAYLGYSKLEGCIYMAYNKNNSEYYLEYIPFNPAEFYEIGIKMFDVISSDELLPKIGNGNPTWYQCKMCDAKDVCHYKKEVLKNCRTCANVDIELGGIWRCSLSKQILNISDQASGCAEYLTGRIFQ